MVQSVIHCQNCQNCQNDLALSICQTAKCFDLAVAVMRAIRRADSAKIPGRHLPPQPSAIFGKAAR